MELNAALILILAFILDAILGDPRWLPHLIVFFGKIITIGEKALNRGNGKVLKGALMVMVLVSGAYVIPNNVLNWIMLHSALAGVLVSALLLFYCLANRTLVEECATVFNELKKEGTEAGRVRLSRIVGRDTSRLNDQQIRIATLETLSENLNDGVIAPLFFYFLFGVPGAMAYKMVNTLDSMIGYKNEKYGHFGKFAARLDDIANLIPARLTALLILLVSLKPMGVWFVFTEGKKHVSPNAGYPEAALAYVLNCQFGGPSYYQGQVIHKPYIGINDRVIIGGDVKTAIRINWLSSALFCLIYLSTFLF